MTSSNSFEMDGTRFIIDVRPGKDRGKSTRDGFVLVKTQPFLDFYRSLTPRAPRTILELGMFEGGSLVYFDKLFRPEQLVGVDIRDEIPALEEYRKTKEHIQTFYRLSQADSQLPSILRQQFPHGIDLIVDDASHHYALTREAFHLCFPLLRPGGLYVVEDWAWSHQPQYQRSAHPWYDKPALTNLIFEWIVNLACNGQLVDITVRRELAVLTKGGGGADAIALDEGLHHLRGRRLEQI